MQFILAAPEPVQAKVREDPAWEHQCFGNIIRHGPDAATPNSSYFQIPRQLFFGPVQRLYDGNIYVTVYEHLKITGSGCYYITIHVNEHLKIFKKWFRMLQLTF